MKINLVEKSRIDSVDFENLTFGKIFTDHMFISKHKDGEWSSGEIKPYENISDVIPRNIVQTSTPSEIV